MSNRPLTDAERNLLAAEFALGLLEGADHAEAERLYLTDAAFAQEADRWLAEGSGWIDELATEGPSADAYERISRGLGLQRSEASEASGVTATRNSFQSAPASRFWQYSALAASFAAIAFAGLWLFDRPALPTDTPAVAEAPVPPYEQGNLSIAQISSGDATSLVSALYDNDTGTLYVKLSDIPDPQRVPQLWLLDSTGNPRSLGFATRSANSEIALSSEQRQIAREGGTLAISLEQPAAEPHASPSDVIGAAQLARLDQQR
ncbi:anti-sigma factor [Aurantiacibacter odishensis]|uniref:anti-sigma factor n=1 Tax=Aurantiacibacter odishensis TaxID=1155476 RepID=UPI000E717061|nr:anti-sigma factor [Aurantiacibacter odishensis]